MAFDALNVDLLLSRLKIMVIPINIIQLISAWLEDSIAYVKVGTECSDYYVVDFGSGQGSILGPVLFNFYMSPSVKSKNVLTFADDLYQLAINKNKARNPERAPSAYYGN